MTRLASAPPVGTFRHRIAIQGPDDTPTAAGETNNWANPAHVCYAWASIEPISGREAYIALAQQQTMTHKIRMLYQPGITARMRAKFGSRILNFVSVTNVGEVNRELEIMAVEVTT